MVEDVIVTSTGLIERSGAESAQEIRDLSTPVILFSPELFADLKQIRAFLFENMYRSDRVNIMRTRSEQVVSGLFDAFMNDAALLPEQWRSDGDDTNRALLISDYLAGMTDGYAEKRFNELHAGT
jgi:dGTPase